MKNRILKNVIILGVCLCLLAGCNNAEKKETLSGNATDKNTESENGEEILLDDIKDDEFKTFILETAIPGKDEGYGNSGWVEDGTCYRVEINRKEDVEGEYIHLADYIFIREDTYKFFKVTYPSKNEPYESDRYVYDACDFAVYYEDVTFDGNKDVVISLGHAGSRGTQIACAYVYEDGEFVYKKSFELIPNYVIDEEEKCVRGWLYDPAGYDNNFIYEYIDGQFVKTEEYITYRTQSQSVSGNQIDSVSKTEIKDVFGNAIFSVSINETDNETTDEDIENEILTACRAYVEYIGENGENIPSILANQSDEFIFVLAYINDDDIPEMIISTNIGMGQESVCVLSYKDGNLTSNTFYYVQYMNIATKSGIINLHSERLFADSYDLNYEIKENGEWEMLYGVREVLVSETDSNQQSHLEIRYYVDNEEVTPDEYKNCSKINFTDYEYYYWDPTADGFESYYCNSENFASLIN